MTPGGCFWVLQYSRVKLNLKVMGEKRIHKFKKIPLGGAKSVKSISMIELDAVSIDQKWLVEVAQSVK